MLDNTLNVLASPRGLEPAPNAIRRFEPFARVLAAQAPQRPPNQPTAGAQRSMVETAMRCDAMPYLATGLTATPRPNGG